MNSSRSLSLFLALFLLAGSATSAHAQWTADGSVVCVAPGAQYRIELVSDGADGAVLVWRDERDDSGDVYAQRIDGGGAMLWAANGVAVCTASGIQDAPKLMADGIGGAFLGWSDKRLANPTAELYVQRISAAGSPLWTSDGRWINYGASLASIVGDGAGGALLVWSEAATYPTSVAVQRINGSGYKVWNDYVTAGTGYNISAVSDGSGGLVAGWQRWWSPSYRNTIHGQRLDAAGTLLWLTDAVSPSYGGDLESDIVSDGSGGGLWAYGYGPAVIARRVDSAGSQPWGVDGVNVFPNLSLMTTDTPQVVADGAGGALVAMASDLGDIHLNRILANGTLAWTANGVTVCAAPAAQIEPRLAPDGSGGAYVVWVDSRDNATTGADIYVEHVNASGALLWGSGGRDICTQTGNQGGVRITATAGGSAVIAWSDARSGSTNLDIYAQAVHGDGTVGDLPIKTAFLSPSGNSVGVPTNGNILVTFSSAAAPGTDWAASVFAHGSQSGLHAGTFSYESVSRTLTFDPTFDFAPGELVTITLTAGIGTASGYTLVPQSWSFTTATPVNDGTFVMSPTTHVVGADPGKLCAADLNGDRIMDLAVANNTANTVSVLIGTGDGGFLPQVTHLTGSGPDDIIALDFERDGDMDLVTVHSYSAEVTLLTNVGGGDFVATAVFSVTGNPRQVCAADFDGDGYVDLAVASQTTGPGSVSILLNDGDGTYGPPSLRNAGSYVHAIAAGDFNRDGYPDLVCGNTNPTNQVTVLLGRGDGFFEPGIGFNGGGPVTGVRGADFDGDGDIDLVTFSHGGLSGARFFLLENGGPADFGAPIYHAGGNADPFDLNGDGYPDVLYPSGAANGIAVRLNDGSGALGAEAHYAAGFVPSDLCTADFDGDGAPDIASLHRSGDAVAIHLNRDLVSGIDPDALPTATRLVRNAPNPFNPRTRIVYTLREAGHVRLTVFDARGAEVATLVDGFLPAREHVATWDGRDRDGQAVATGVYFCRIQAGGYRETMKMTLLR